MADYQLDSFRYIFTVNDLEAMIDDSGFYPVSFSVPDFILLGNIVRYTNDHNISFYSGIDGADWFADGVIDIRLALPLSEIETLTGLEGDPIADGNSFTFGLFWNGILTPVLTGISDDSGVAGDNITNVATQTISGNLGGTLALAPHPTDLTGGPDGLWIAPQAKQVEIMLDAQSFGLVETDLDGNWSVEVPSLAEGLHVIEARQKLSDGSYGSLSAPLEFTIDRTSDPAPSMPDLVAASDTGVSNTDNNTTDTTPTFVGLGVNGSTITLYAGPTVIGSAVVANGEYEITSTALGIGTHQITAESTDIAGNVSPSSPVLIVVIEAPQSGGGGAPGEPEPAGKFIAGTDDVEAHRYRRWRLDFRQSGR